MLRQYRHRGLGCVPGCFTSTWYILDTLRQNRWVPLASNNSLGGGLRYARMMYVALWCCCLLWRVRVLVPRAPAGPPDAANADWRAETKQNRANILAARSSL